MNANLSILICGALMAFVCADARAQDTSRVPDVQQEVSETDPSVHADVLEPAKEQPQLPRKYNRQPASYSRWAFQTANQPPATRFGLIPATSVSTAFAGGANAPPTVDTSLKAGLQTSTPNSLTGAEATSELTPKTEGRSGKLTEKRLDPGLSMDRALNNRDHSVQPIPSSRPSTTKVLPPPLQLPAPTTTEFSTGLHENKLGLTNSSAFSDSFPRTTVSSKRNLDKGKQRKHNSLKHAKTTHAAKSLDSTVTKKK
jgi:hypothetical protein